MSHHDLDSLLPLAVVFPLAGAALSPILARIWRHLPLFVALAALLGSAGILLAAAPVVFSGRLLVEFLGHIGPIDGHVLGIGLAADGFGLGYALLTALVGALLIVYTLSELGNLGPRELGGYTALFLLLCGALIGSALTADLFNMFVWFEVVALSSYALTAFFLERPIALEAAFKIVVLTTIAGFLIFIGASLIYADHGALDLAQIHDALARKGHLQTVDLVALALLLAGFATKAGIVPFHGWLPDAHSAAPGPVSALFSGLMVNLGIVAVARLVFQVYTPAMGHHILGLLMVAGLVSAVAGAGFALVQDDLKRLLGYDTISQMGVLLVGLGSGSPGGLTGAAYHLINHGLFKTLLFLCAGSILHMTGATDLSQMGGLAKRYPLLAAAFVVGVLAIAGIPPMNGYVSLGLIHDSLRSSGRWVPFAFMMVAQVLTTAALGKAAWQAFFAKRTARHDYDWQQRLRPGMIIGLSLLAAGCIAFGCFPTVLIGDVWRVAAGSLLHPSAYASGVLSGGGPIAPVAVSFDYWSPVDLIAVAGTIVAAIPLAIVAMRFGSGSVVARIRSVQTGSANDYAAYLAGGVIFVICFLAGSTLF